MVASAGVRGRIGARAASTAVGALTALFALEGSAHAEPAAVPVASEVVDADARMLAGHTFLRPVLDDSAFLATTVGFRQGLLYIDGGSVASPTGREGVSAAAAIESLDTTVKVVDWLAVSARGDLQALVGASPLTLFGNTSSLAAGFQLGPVVRLARVKSTGTQVALRPYHRATFGALLDVSHVVPLVRGRIQDRVGAPLPTAQEATRDVSALENDIVGGAVTPLRRSAWGASLNVAQGLGPFFGVQFSYELTRERFAAAPYDFERRDRVDAYFVSLTHRITLAVDFDAAPLGAPVAVMLEAVVATGRLRPEATDTSAALDTTLLVGPGLYYSGRRSMQLGLFGGVQTGLAPYATPYGPSEDPLGIYAQFALRNFF